MNSPYFATLCAAAAVLIGCSTYGWAQAHDADDAPPAVDVATFAGPAGLGLDTASLRALLVDELQYQGVRVDSSAPEASLYCTVTDDRTTGFGTSAVAEITLSCDILRRQAGVPDTTVEARGLSAHRLGSEQDRLQAVWALTQRAPTLAIYDAIDRLAFRIADQLAETKPSRDDDPRRLD